MVDSKVVPFDEFYYQLKLMHLFQKHPVYTVSQTHAPGKKGEIFIKGQINNSKNVSILNGIQEKNSLIRPIKAF
jgi:hypothetical protein